MIQPASRLFCKALLSALLFQMVCCFTTEKISTSDTNSLAPPQDDNASQNGTTPQENIHASPHSTKESQHTEQVSSTSDVSSYISPTNDQTVSNDQEIDTLNVSYKVDDVLSELCIRAQGNWLGKEKSQCVCPNQGVFVIYKGDQPNAKCLPIRFSPLEAWQASCHDSTQEDWYDETEHTLPHVEELAYIVAVQNPEVSQERDKKPYTLGVYKLHLPHPKLKCSKQVLNWLDRFRNDIHHVAPIWHNGTSFIDISFDFFPPNNGISDLFKQLMYFNFPAPTTIVNEYVLPYEVLDPTLTDLFHQQKQTNPSLHADWQALQQNIDRIRLDATQGEWFVVDEQRPIEYGSFYATTRLFAFNADETLQGHRAYCSGAICHEYWIIRQKNSDPVAIVAFSPNHLPIYFFTYHYTKQAAKAQVSIVLHNHRGYPVASHDINMTWDYLLQSTHPLKSQETIHQDQPTVLLLDTISSDQSHEAILSNIVIGPQSPLHNSSLSTFQGSILGWSTNRAASFFEFTHATMTSRFGLPTALVHHDQDSLRHGNLVALAMLQRDPHVQIIPLGVNHLQHKKNYEFLNNIPSFVRVGTSPLLYNGDGEKHCKWLYEDFFQKQSASILWFISAGNEAMSSCIPYLANLPNVIIVGSYNPRFPVAYKDATPYLHVLDDGVLKATLPDQNFIHEAGASFAAPRAAVTVAAFWQQHPHLTMEQVKTWLLQQPKSTLGFGFVPKLQPKEILQYNKLYFDHEVQK